MIDIRYINDRVDLWMQAADCNAKLSRCEIWLENNVGERWVDWDFMQYGVVRIHNNDEAALLFKLKFGV